MMRRLSAVSGLILTGLCLVASQQPGQGFGGDIDAAIGDVFGNSNDRSVSTSTTTPVPNSLKDLIGKQFSNGQRPMKQDGINNEDGGTILGSTNSGNTAESAACECVPYYQCQNGTIITNGIGLIDLRSDFNADTRTETPPSLSGRCESYLDVCCTPAKAVTQVVPPGPGLNGCGWRQQNGVGFRITGDKNNEAQFGEFPWMMAILEETVIAQQNASQRLNVYQCGGSLINYRAVLTAAHCVARKQASALKVRAGEWDTKIKTEILPHQDRGVSKIIVHERFDRDTLDNDFAILILDRPVDHAANVDTVCLPQQEDLFDASRCFVTGWGKNTFDAAGRYQVILKKIELPVVGRDTCQNSLRTTRLGRYFILSPTFICAGGESGKDACKGDGGSPLVCPLKSNPTRYAQAGIVAWGIGCGENGVPGVYANVAGARRWIDNTIAFNNLDTLAYTY